MALRNFLKTNGILYQAFLIPISSHFYYIVWSMIVLQPSKLEYLDADFFEILFSSHHELRLSCMYMTVFDLICFLLPVLYGFIYFKSIIIIKIMLYTTFTLFFNWISYTYVLNQYNVKTCIVEELTYFNT